jgi:hypothetical protein
MSEIQDWQECEAMGHVGPVRDATVAWVSLGLMCDACSEALGDTRPLQQQLAAAVEAAGRTRAAQGRPARRRLPGSQGRRLGTRHATSLPDTMYPPRTQAATASPEHGYTPLRNPCKSGKPAEGFGPSSS